MAQFSQLRAQVKADALREDFTDTAKLVRALVMPAMFVAYADGRLDKAERQALANILARDHDMQQAALNGEDVVTLFDTIHADVQSEDPEDLIQEALDAMDEAQRLRSIGYALQVANADGEFDTEEQGTLVALAKNFGVTLEQINEMLRAQAAPASSKGEAV